MLKHLIINWNKKRGLLETFDPSLEIKMLSEEAKEFYTASSFEHRLVEYADFVFVKTGTLAKIHSQVFDSTVDFFINREHSIKLMEWAEEVESNMISVLSGMYQYIKYDSTSTGTEHTFDTILKQALIIVIKNNSFKGKEKKDGKIIKSDDQGKPETEMRKFLYEN